MSSTPRRRLAPSAAVSTGSASDLLQLPPDLLPLVLSRLQPRELACMVAACRALQLSDDAALWLPHCRTLSPSHPEAEASRRWFGARARLCEGVVLCCTHLSAADRDWAYRAVEAMGGGYSYDLHMSSKHPLQSRVTHLVCGCSLTPKAIGAWRRIHVVRTEWLKLCVSRATLLPAAEFAAPVLLGVTVCCTGMETFLRRWTRERVEELGGTWEAAFDSRVTHLLVGPELAYEFHCAQRQQRSPFGTAKVLGAQALGRPIVHAAKWLQLLSPAIIPRTPHAGKRGKPVDPVPECCLHDSTRPWVLHAPEV